MSFLHELAFAKSAESRPKPRTLESGVGGVFDFDGKTQRWV
jgi:hypothetical protein